MHMQTYIGTHTSLDSLDETDQNATPRGFTEARGARGIGTVGGIAATLGLPPATVKRNGLAAPPIQATPSATPSPSPTTLALAHDLQAVWSKTLQDLKRRVPDPTYRTWFPNVTLLSVEDVPLTEGERASAGASGTRSARSLNAMRTQVATLSVPSAFAGEWLQKRYYKVLRAVLSSALERDVNDLAVAFKIVPPQARTQAGTGTQQLVSPVQLLTSGSIIHALDGIRPLSSWGNGLTQLPIAAGQYEFASGGSGASIRASSVAGAGRARHTSQEISQIAPAGRTPLTQPVRITDTPGVMTEASSELSVAGEREVSTGSHQGHPQRPQARVHGSTPLLNPLYTFQRFYIGSSNQLAVSVARKVAEQPGVSYNPLVILGRPGTGKTHLLQAIAHDARSRTGLEVIYASSLLFRDMYQSSRGPLSPQALNKIASKVDLLLVDDLHFLARAEARCGQKILLQVVEHLLAASKGVVVASSQALTAMMSLDPALRARLGQGAVVDLNPPEPALLSRIFRRFAAQAQVQTQAQAQSPIMSSMNPTVTMNTLTTPSTVAVAEEAFDGLVRLGMTLRNARDAWERVVAHCAGSENINNVSVEDGDIGGSNDADASNNGKGAINVTAYDVRQVLSRVSSVAGRARRVSLDTIADRVAAYYDLELRDLRCVSRRHEVMLPRQIAMYLMREETEAAFSSIALYFGKRDHTTALHSYNKIEHLVEIDSAIRETVLLLRQMIYDEHGHAHAQAS